MSYWLVYLAIPLLLLVFFRQSIVDLLVLWTVATAGRKTRRKMSRQNRLHVYVSQTKILDEVSVSELYTLARELVSSDNVDISQFHRVILSYKYACMFRERTDGSLRGMLMLDVHKDSRHNNCQFTCIKLGLALFKHEYRGGPYAYLVCAYHAVKELIFHPRTPLYLICKCFSYKSYLAILHSCPVTYPRVGVEIPTWEKSLMDEFGRSLETDTGKYLPETCVVQRSHCSLKAHAAPLTEEEFDNRNIRFFVEKNPGWQKGHCLIVLSQITWGVLFQVLWNACCRMLKSSGSADEGRRRHVESTSRHGSSSTTSSRQNLSSTLPRPSSHLLQRQHSVEEVHSMRQFVHLCPLDPESICIANTIESINEGDEFAEVNI